MNRNVLAKAVRNSPCPLSDNSLHLSNPYLNYERLIHMELHAAAGSSAGLLRLWCGFPPGGGAAECAEQSRRTAESLDGSPGPGRPATTGGRTAAPGLYGYLLVTMVIYWSLWLPPGGMYGNLVANRRLMVHECVMSSGSGQGHGSGRISGVGPLWK